MFCAFTEPDEEDGDKPAPSFDLRGFSSRWESFSSAFFDLSFSRFLELPDCTFASEEEEARADVGCLSGVPLEEGPELVERLVFSELEAPGLSGDVGLGDSAAGCVGRDAIAGNKLFLALREPDELAGGFSGIAT